MVIIDNYDSFTYNLVHYVEELLNEEIVVMRNDEIDYSAIDTSNGIILSPGPGLPTESGELMQIISKYHKTKTILGVCLGHQAIAEFFGAELLNLKRVLHGVSTNIELDSTDPVFANLPTNIEVGHYHSWVVDNKNVPEELKITSRDHNQIIMSLRHKTLPIWGVQFHPESVLTPLGKTIISNFVRLVK